MDLTWWGWLMYKKINQIKNSKIENSSWNWMKFLNLFFQLICDTARCVSFYVHLLVLVLYCLKFNSLFLSLTCTDYFTCWRWDHGSSNNFGETSRRQVRPHCLALRIRCWAWSHADSLWMSRIRLASSHSWPRSAASSLCSSPRFTTQSSTTMRMSCVSQLHTYILHIELLD